MEIKVKGIGEKSFKPDVIRFSFTFNIKRKTYKACLADGTKNVEDYFKYLTSKGFVKEEIKTDNFNVHRERIYNEELRKYEEGDYVFSFYCNLIVKYDLDLMSQIMEETAKIKECEAIIKEAKIFLETFEKDCSQNTITKNDVQEMIDKLKEYLMNPENIQRSKFILSQYIESIRISNE